MIARSRAGPAADRFIPSDEPPALLRAIIVRMLCRGQIANQHARLKYQLLHDQDAQIALRPSTRRRSSRGEFGRLPTHTPFGSENTMSRCGLRILTVILMLSFFAPEADAGRHCRKRWCCQPPCKIGTGTIVTAHRMGGQVAL